MKERRASLRLNCDHSITYSHLRIEAGKIQDLSESGIKIKTHQSIMVENDLEMFIPLDEGSITAQGCVSHVQRVGDIYDVGIYFTEIDEETRQSLLEFFKKNGPEEMRRSSRLHCEHSISYFHQGMGAGKMLDLSNGGVKIKTHRPFRLETDVEMFMSIKGTSVIAKGRVARVQRMGELYNVGIYFTEIDEENKQSLLEFFKNTSPEEMRRSPRIHCDHSISYARLGMGEGDMLDLSDGGVGIKSTHPFMAETEVEMSIPLEGRFITAKGRVARVQRMGELYDVGISFTEIDEGNKQSLLEFFKEGSSREMRRSPRLHCEHSISYYNLEMGAGKMLDLSKGGIKIKATRPLTVDTDVEMFLPIDEMSIIAKGRVARVQRTGELYDVGISFTEIDEGNKQSLLEYFKQGRSHLEGGIT